MLQIEAEYGLNLGDFFEKMQKVSATYGTLDAQLSSLSKQNPLAEITRRQQGYNQLVGQQIQIYQRSQAAVTSFRAEQKRLEDQYKDLNTQQSEFAAAGRYGELKDNIAKVTGKLEEMNVPLVKTDSLWDKIKAKFSAGLKIPKLNVPDLPAAPDRDDKGRFLPNGDRDGNSDSKKKKKKSNFLGEAGDALLDEVGGASGLNLSNGTLAAGAAVAAVTATIVKGTKEWAEYGEKLSEVSALTGATGKSLAFLDEQAQLIEADTGIAGTTVLEAFKNIGGIKPEVLENKELLVQTTKEVIALSQASKLSLDDSAKALLGSLSQFGEGAEEASRYANVLAAGAKLGNSEVNDTAEALKNAGTAMKAAGLSFEEGNSLLQILGKGMIKGSEAGTALRNILLKLETDTDKNLRPSIVGLDKALENAAKKYDTTSKQAKVFGTENIVAAKQILSARTEVAKMTESLTGTSVAYEQSKINSDNLATDLQKAGTSINAFFRNLGQSNDSFLRDTVKRFTNFVNDIGSKTSVFKTFISSYVHNEEDGLIGALFTAAKDANAQRQKNLDNARKQAEIKGIVTASTQSVQDDLANIQKLYEKKGEVESVAERKAADSVKKARDQSYNDAVAAHARLRKELEKEIKETGKDSGKLNVEFEKSRRQLLATTTAKKLADNRVAKLKKEVDDQAANLANLLNEPASKEKEKANKKALNQENESRRLLLAAQEDYAKEAQKLELEYGKERLEALDKNGQEYINARADIEQKALEIQRDAMEKRLQLAKSEKTVVVNGKRQVVADKSITLENSAPEIAQIFADKQQQIEQDRARQLELSRIRQEYKLIELSRQSNETELQLFDKQWEEKLLLEKKNTERYHELIKERDEARTKIERVYSKQDLAAFDNAWKEILANEAKNSEVYQAMVAKRNRDRNALVSTQILEQTRKQESIELAYTDTDRYAQQLRTEGDQRIGQAADPNLNALQIAQKREQAKLAIRIKAGEDTIALLREQGEKENALLIIQTEAAVDGLKKQQAELKLTTPKFNSIYDVLGITNGMDEIQLAAFEAGMQRIGESIQQVTQLLIEESNQRIASLDAEIKAKEDQVEEEEKRNKEGFANNLAIRKAELNDLRRQKAEEERVRQNAVRVQQSLELASTLSSSVLTTQKAIEAAVTAFSEHQKLGPVVGLVTGLAAVATVIATIASIRARIRALSMPTVMREGGRLQGAKHEHGGIPGTGSFSDIEVEGGEHVTNARSSERFNKTLESLNKNDPQRALRSLVREGGVGLPLSVIHQIKRPDFGVRVQGQADQATSREIVGLKEEMRESREVNKKMAKDIARLANRKTITPLANGGYIETDVDGNQHIHKP